MNNNEKKSQSFVGYEYKEVTIKQSLEQVYADGYANFGWEIEDRAMGLPVGSVTLKMKRDRKIRNKAELVRLQRKFEADVEEIDALERSKYTMASVVAYVVGVIGAAFMAGSVFAITGGSVVWCIIFAIPAFIGWILPYFLYKKIVRNKTAEANSFIESKYDDVYEVCEKASRLS
ncbi:MAG: hypothetical protein ACK5MU_01030 [Candidatus Saccharimonadales bacterium]